MKKTLMTELFMTVLWITLGLLGYYFLSGTLQVWLLPLFTCMILLAYLVRWQFVVVAGLLMSLIPAFITLLLTDNFSLVSLILSVVELTGTGLLICFSYQHWKWEIHPSLVFGIVFGRTLGGVAAWIMEAMFRMCSFSNLYQYTVNSLVDDVCGIAVQLMFVPLIVMFVFQRFYTTGKRR